MLKTHATQTGRPSIEEAAKEAFISTDSHWTASLSKIGMTRISRAAVLNTFSYDYYYG